MRKRTTAHFGRALLAVVIAAKAKRDANPRFFLAAIVIASKTEPHTDTGLFLGAVVIRAPLADAIRNTALQQIVPGTRRRCRQREQDEAAQSE